MTMNTAQTIKVGGEAGAGVMSAGLLISKIATRSGYHIFDYTEYPSLIRGGHNVMQISVSTNQVCSQFKSTDILIALNQETIDLHAHELTKNSYLIYDSNQPINTDKVNQNVNIIAIPLIDMVKSIKGSYIMRNTIAVGALVALTSSNLHILKDLIKEELNNKNEEVLNINMLACELGYKYIIDNYKSKINTNLETRDNKNKQIVITGNEAIALGAIAAGMKFAAIYPMTPTSNILHILAPLQEKYNFVYKQPEDEISAINMAIGASYAGARSMVATSGGGFCLMSEGYGLAGITETPVVIIEGMRGAPATGLPTWTEQGDLRFILHAHQGDFPRIILAAGDIEECFHLAMQAFNLADKYQTPVVVIVDKYVCESHMSVKEFEYEQYKYDRGNYTTKILKDYKRYNLNDNGISQRSIPGSGNIVMANSDEHNEKGYSTEDIETRNLQMHKRMKKLETCEIEDMQSPILYGPQEADTTIVSWGSNKGPIIEALKDLKNTNYLHLTWINPFPTEQVTQILKKAKRIINIECNYSMQMLGLLKEKTLINIEHSINKYDGRPFYPEEIIERINQL